MRFIEPIWGLLFLPLLVGLFFSWRKVHGMVPARKAIAFSLRFLLIGSFIFALMNPQSVQKNKGLTTLFVLDRSDSVNDVDKSLQGSIVQQAMSSMGEDDQIGVVVFGSTAVMESSPGGKRIFAPVESVIDGSASDLSAALRLAMASFPAGKGRRIVLVTDGNETKGDAFGTIESIAAEGVTIDFVPLGLKKTRDEANILELQSPSEQVVGQPFELKAVVESNVAQTGHLVIERNGSPISQTPVSIPAGTSTIVVNEKLEEAGFFRYRAFLKVSKDTDNRNNLGSTFVSVKGRPKVLIVQGDPTKQELARALTEQGISVVVGGSSSIPTRPEDLQQYEALIFNDFNASFTSEYQMKLVRNSIRDSGIGFMMVGGEDSFLPGGWFGTPIAEALPVDLNIRQRKVFPNTSVLIVVDTSGSMSMNVGGTTKLKLAASAAVLTVQLLGPTDRLGVAGSGSRIDYVAPLAQLNDKASVIAKARTLKDGGGGIYAEPSIKFAQEKLGQENTRVKHLILVADGSDCDQHGISLAIAAEMKTNKTTISTVAIGTGKDVPFLRNLAAVGGGRHYLVEDAKRLPQIFTQDVSLMARSAIEEGAFIPKVVGSDEVTRGIESWPALMAYCLTEERPLARVAMRTHKNDPLYASWQFGLGKSVAFTSDAQNRWAKEWVQWGGFGQFWAQGVRSLTRKAALNNYDLSVTPEGGKGKVVLTARDKIGNPIAKNTIDVKVSDPEGESQNIVLTQVAPGVFEGDFDAPSVGSYIVSVVEPGAGGENRVAANGFSIPYPPEYRSYRTNLPLLESIADATDGKKLESGQDAMRPVAVVGESVRDLWRQLLWLALVLLPIDVFVRRVIFPLPKFARKRDLEAFVKQPNSPAKVRANTAQKQQKKKMEPTHQEPISAAGSLLEAKRKMREKEKE